MTEKLRFFYLPDFKRWAYQSPTGVWLGPFGVDSLHDWLTALSARGVIHG